MSKPKTVTDEERKDANRWLIYEFNKMNAGGNAPQWITNSLDKSLAATVDDSDGFIKKISKIRKLKKITFIDPVNYICTVFKAESLALNISVNYGFLYSSDRKYHAKYDRESTNNPIILMYCVAPSLLSQDGEYRNRLLRTGQLTIVTQKYQKIFEYMEKFLIHKIEKYELNLEYEHFFPQQESEGLAEELDNKIVEAGCVLKFFAMFWLIEIFNISINLQENHINPKFNQIFFQHLDDDIKEFKTICAKFGADKITEMINMSTLPIFTSTKENGKVVTSSHSVGQKLRPLNVGEVQEPLNILFGPWREIYLSAKAADLLANTICPNFAIFLDWFYIKNSKKGLFDNEQQYKKLEFSERALAITRKLRETQRITYTREEKNKKFLNGMFQTLYDKIEDPINFAKANLLMSNVTLGFITENVGRTVFDLPSLDKSSVWTSVVGHVTSDPMVFRKYVWDVCYGLLCLNVKCGMTHSDLHLNNVTINNLDTQAKTKNAYAVYNVMGYWFGLETLGPYACIIDFSRGTIHPREVEKYPHFRNRDEFNEFVDDQNYRMLNTLEQTVPTFMKMNKQKIIELLKTDFDKFYKLYSAVDTYNFCTKLGKYFEKISVKANLDLVQKIAKVSEHYLTNVMLKVINNPDLQIDWPIFSILKECFTDNVFDPVQIKPWNIIDLWIFDKPMQYSLEKYKDWPPMLKELHGMKNSSDPKSIYLIDSATYLDKLRKGYEQFRNDQMKMVKYIARRHQEKYQ